MLACARRWGYLTATQHRWALLETAAGVGLWLALAAQVGLLSFLFVYVLPLLVANAIVMGFILTNHSLSPMTDQNDPLLSSLSVTLPPALGTSRPRSRSAAIYGPGSPVICTPTR